MLKLLFLIGCFSTPTIILGSEAKGRFFSLFNIVKFDNAPCTPEDGTDEPQGVCYSEDDCNNRNSKYGGNCAAGFGKCCIVKEWEDGKRVNEPISYFQNEDFPSSTKPEADTRVFTVSVTDPDVCQVRIDFDEFDLAPPTSLGACDEQSIVIDESIAFCGQNKDQNYVVHIDKPTSFNIIMNVATDASSYSYKHNLRVTQVDCTSKNQYMEDIRAPKGCDQYFNETSGIIKSFNYDGENMYAENQDYSICIKKSENSCGIKYSNCNDNTCTNVDSTKKRSIGAAVIPRGGAGPTSCTDGTATGTAATGCGEQCLTSTLAEDWLTIANGQLANADLSDSSSYKAYYCGQGLGIDTDTLAENGIVEGDGVRDYSDGPFILHFHTNSNNADTASTGTTQVNNLGFVIDYHVQTGRC